ncbi:MAG: peptidoglycan DD-metalloendopeptidase family protein [Flavobacteriaceae bacterium]|nr:peptidoglycan DD-metalloendopeptidase family protein [Flavobacteriaceae bacterium]MCY4216907.1 peptidoglycan DD-metalloendopeptidase family protein [Flavobacteriaceae bacterium]
MKCLLFCFFIILGSVHLLGQTSQNRKNQLFERQKELRIEIRELNALMSKIKIDSRDVLVNLEETNLKVNQLNELIDIHDQQNIILDSLSITLEDQMASQQKTLDQLKVNYALVIKAAHKSRVDKNAWMMILFSKNFIQGYKRNQYIQHYVNNRRNIKNEIEQRVSVLETKADSLLTIRQAKQELQSARIERLKDLEKETFRQRLLLRSYSRQEKNFVNQINQKRELDERLELEIQTLVEEVVASKSDDPINFGGDFHTFKGKLPWPVEEGVVTRKFGRQYHPIVPTIIIENLGITMATKPNSQVRSVFDGKVVSILSFRGSNYSVLIQHGQYITVYKNLVDLKVESGQAVDALQVIGNAFTNQKTGRSSFTFSLFENTQAKNPIHWLRSRS